MIEYYYRHHIFFLLIAPTPLSMNKLCKIILSHDYAINSLFLFLYVEEDEVDRPDRCHDDGGRWRRAPHPSGRSDFTTAAEAVSNHPKQFFDVTGTHCVMLTL